MYEQLGVRPDIEDFALVRIHGRSTHRRLEAFRHGGMYAFPEFSPARQPSRRRGTAYTGFNVIRSNPRLRIQSHWNADHASPVKAFGDSGRDWKPGAMDAMQDGWAPVALVSVREPDARLFGQPVEAGRRPSQRRCAASPVTIGAFPVCAAPLECLGDTPAIRVPAAAIGEDGPLAIP